MNDTLTRLLPSIGGHRFLLTPMASIPNHDTSIREGINGELDVYDNNEYGPMVCNNGDFRVVNGVIVRATDEMRSDKSLKPPTDEVMEALSSDDIVRLEITTLSSWLDAMGELETGHLTIELKGSSVAKVVDLAEKVDDILYNYRDILPLNRVAVESFCVEAMAKVVERFERDEDDGTRYVTGLLWASKADYIVMDMHKPAIDDVADMGSDEVTPWWLKGLIQASGMNLNFISVHWTLVTDEFLAVAKRLGLEVCCWVVGDVDKARELADKNVYVLTESAEVYETISAQ